MDKIQGNLNAGRGDEVFGGKLVGIQLADSGQSSALFTLGNFEITTNVSANQNRFKLPDFDRVLTAKDIVNGGITDLNKLIQGNEIEINYDKTKLFNFVEYGSLKEGFKNALTEIIQKYPAGLVVSTSIDNNIRDYVYDSVNNISTFLIKPTNILNPFNIIYTNSGTTLTDLEYVTKYRNFSKNFSEFSIKYNNTEYEIFDVQLPNDNSESFDFEISVIGKPFDGSGTINESFIISPTYEIIENEINGLSDLAYYLLNWNGRNRYTAKFTIPVESNNGNLVNQTRYLTFPLIDEYNLDIISDNYDDYINQLYEIADDLDNSKTNLINRFLTTSAFKEYDTPDKKISTILQLSGQNLDKLKKYIQGIQHMRKVSYDKIDNVPDLLVKNFATMLGWETFEIEDENTLIESLFNFNQTDEVNQNDITPIELDIELWRRLVINSFYLFKSKGTRKSIEVILKMVGVPMDIVEIIEYVYVAQNKLNYNQINELVNDISRHPINKDGYPTIPQSTYFQSNGGYITKDRRNLGNYDYGNNYVSKYSRFDDIYAFDLYQTVDNKKSWLKSNNRVNLRGVNTNYTVNNTDLIVNSKELDIFLSSNRVFDVSMFRFFKNNNINIDSNLFSGFTTNINPNLVTFNDYLREVVSQIDPRNRKVISSYPKLSKLYYEYLIEVENLNLNEITYSKSLAFLSKFDNYWVKLIQQFIPATSILTTGKKIQNSELIDNKHIYKHGKNDDVDWLGTDGSEFQNKAEIPVWNGKTKHSEMVTIVNRTKVFQTEPISLKVDYSEGVSGFLDRKSKYSSYYYGFFDYCDYKSTKLLEKHGDFGTFTNIETSSDTTSGINYYSQLGIKLNTDYGDKIVVAPTNYEGSVSSVTLDDVNTLSKKSLKIESLPINLSYNKQIHIELTDVNIEANTEYQIEVVYKYDGNGYQYTFDIESEGSTVISTNTITLNNDWLKVTKVITTTASTIDVKFISDKIFDNVTVFIDTIEVRQHSSQDFDSAYDNLNIDFFCPPPIPHICYLPYMNGVTGNTLINSIFDTSINGINISNWELISLSQLNFPISFVNANGLLINNTSNTNNGIQQILLNKSKIINKSIDSEIYFESKFLTANSQTAKVTPVLVDANNHNNIIVTYDNYWDSASTTEDILFSIRGYFENDDIPVGDYHFGFLIEHTVTSTFKFKDIKVGVKFLYGDNDEQFSVKQLPTSFSGHTQINNNFNPLMHVKSNTINRRDVNLTDESVEINLMNQLDLKYVFYNPTNYYDSVYSVDGVINNQTFLSDSLTFDIEAIYPTKSILQNNVELGPFYTISNNTYTDNLNQTSTYETYSLYGEVDNTYNCLVNQTTILGILNPFINVTGSTFDSEVSDMKFINQSDSNYFEAKNTKEFKFNVSLIFESIINTEQEVIIKLVNEFGATYAEESFIFAGSDNPNYQDISERTCNVDFIIPLSQSDKVYIAVEPLNADCQVLESEDIVFNNSFNIINPNSESSLGLNAGNLSDKYNNITHVRSLSGVFDNDIFNYTIGVDEYTRLKLNITEKPTEFIPNEYKVINGYLLSTGKNYDEITKTGWSEDGSEFYICQTPVNRMDFYPYVPNNTLTPLDRDWTPNQSILDTVQVYQEPVFTGYTYNQVSNFATGTTLISGNTLSGETITLTKFSSVRVYQTTISGMSIELADNLDFFNSDLTIKNKYKNQKYDLEFFNKYYDELKGLNVELVNQGVIKAKSTVNGVNLEYFFEKNYANLPKTGEYIVKINMSDICNNNVTAYAIFLITSDYTQANIFNNTTTSLIQSNLNTISNSTVTESKPDAPIIINNQLVMNNERNHTITLQFEGINNGYGNINWFGEINGSTTINNTQQIYTQSYLVQPNTNITFNCLVDLMENNDILEFTANGNSFGSELINLDNTKIRTGTINNITQDYLIVIKVINT